MHTAFPAFQDALLALVAGAVDVPYSLGWPAGGLQDTHVWISGSGTVDVNDGVTGWSQRDETLSVEIRVYVAYTSDDYADARDTAISVSEDIEDALAADVTLAGLVTFAQVSSIRIDEAIPDERTRSVGIALTVTAQATAQ